MLKLRYYVWVSKSVPANFPSHLWLLLAQTVWHVWNVGVLIWTSGLSGNQSLIRILARWQCCAILYSGTFVSIRCGFLLCIPISGFHRSILVLAPAYTGVIWSLLLARSIFRGASTFFGVWYSVLRLFSWHVHSDGA